VLTFICRIAVCLLVLFSYPLQIHPCRISIENLLRQVVPSRYLAKVPDLALHLAMSFFVFGVTFLVAFFAGGNLTTVCCFSLLCFFFALIILIICIFRSSDFQVFGVVGATASTTMGYILPASFYLKLKWSKPWRCKKISAAIMGVSGVILMIVSLIFIIINAIM
jgi:amino acid permease